MQIFVSDKVVLKVYPMASAIEFPAELQEFLTDVGVTEFLVAEQHCSNKSKEVKAFCKKNCSTLRLLEQNTQWGNCSELYVGLVKKAYRKDVKVSGLPLVLWYYAAQQGAVILYLTARDVFQLQGSNLYIATFGEEDDISNLCPFSSYE